jgi:hypothetical protein
VRVTAQRAYRALLAPTATAVLSPETKWEVFLQVTSRELSRAPASAQVECRPSTVIVVRRTVKGAAMAVLATKPGRPVSERNFGGWSRLVASWRS